jgi:transposase
MPEEHPRAYPLECRSKIIELIVRAVDRKISQPFELSNQTIRNWIRHGDHDTGKRTDGLTSEERTELSCCVRK